jgi:hypothetical protein
VHWRVLAGGTTSAITVNRSMNSPMFGRTGQRIGSLSDASANAASAGLILD